MTRPTPASRPSGFTLLELVLVLHIVGTLAATAIPRFMDLGREARIAKVQGAMVAGQSAVNMVVAKWATSGGGTSVTLSDGSVVNMVDVSATNPACGTTPSGCGCVPDTDGMARMLALQGGNRVSNAGVVLYGGNGTLNSRR